MIGVGIGLSDRRRRAAVSWSPASIAGKVLWLRGDLGITNVGGHVTVWADQSGAGNDMAAPGTQANQPIPATWTAGKSAPACYYDGNDTMNTAGLIIGSAAGAPYTIFVACSFDDLAAHCVLSTSSTGGTRVSQSVSGTSKLEDWKVGAVFSTDGASVTTPQNLVFVEQVGSSPNSILWRNGTLTATSAASTSTFAPGGAACLGAAVSGTYHLGYIAEVVITNTRATAGEIAAWNAYSFNRYGV